MKASFKFFTLTFFFGIIPSISFAFFCPTNFSQIEFGMTVDQVTQLCGKPDEQKEIIKESENIPQEWDYYIPQTVYMGGSNPNPQGTLKTSVTFDNSGNAINISVNGIGVGTSSICGANIKLGDSRDKIKNACGEPSFVTKQQLSPENTPPPVKIIEFDYKGATPPTTLIFENGMLKNKE